MRSDRLTEVHHDGLVLPVIDAGPIDGQSVVLLHGFPQTATAWDAVSPLLHAAGYRTFAPTQRGYSSTAKPRGRLNYRAAKLVGDVTAVITAIDAGPVHIVGHDWGAAAAWFTTGGHPEVVASLTSVGIPDYRAFLAAMIHSDQLRRSYYFGVFQLPLFPELLFDAFPDSFINQLRATGMNDAGLAAVQTDVLDAGNLTSALNWYRGLVVSSQRTMCRASSVPTTVIWGDADRLINRTGIDRTAANVAGPYRLEVIPDAGHWMPDTHPDLLAAAIIRALSAPGA